ncbi:unnamed protein product [Natator depressus]
MKRRLQIWELVGLQSESGCGETLLEGERKLAERIPRTASRRRAKVEKSGGRMLSMVLSCGLQLLHLILGMEVLTVDSFSPALCKQAWQRAVLQLFNRVEQNGFQEISRA